MVSGEFSAGYEWDEAKNQLNIRKHGIDFRDAVRIFERPTLDRIDDRRDYGEVRTNSIGSLDDPSGGIVIAMVTHTDRAAVIRLISARAASTGEREAYRAFERRLGEGFAGS